MGIFSNILDKLRHLGQHNQPGGGGGTPSAPGRAPGQQQQDSRGMPGQQQSGVQPISNVDVEKVLSDLAAKKGGGGNWRTSIVDTLKLLDMDSSLDARKQLAEELQVHAGAHAIHDTDHDNANVNVEGGFFGVKVAVARYEDQAGEQAILDYYRKELAKFGSVAECRGNLDFKDSLSAPRCKERSRDEIQLGAGKEHDNHIVSVKPRGDATEFTLIHVQTGS